MIHVHGTGNYHHRMSVKEANWMLLQISKCAQRPNIWHAINNKNQMSLTSVNLDILHMSAFHMKYILFDV